MTKLAIIATILAVIGVIANAARYANPVEAREEMMKLISNQRERAKLVVKRDHAKTETTTTYVTTALYSDSDCTTISLWVVYGTNQCVTISGATGVGSMQLLYTSTSDTAGTLTLQYYSDSACATTTGSAETIMSVTGAGTCSSMMLETVSTTLTLPTSDGYAVEFFNSASSCSSGTPYMGSWVSTGTTPVDDAYILPCTAETIELDDDYAAGGSTSSYTSTSCTGDCPSSGSSSSSKSCFAGSETVTMESGEVKAISEVVRGDRVLAADANGNTKFSTVVAVPHAANNDAAVFTHITAASGADIKMTEDHLLMVSPACSGSAELMAASTVEAGMCVMTTKAMEKVASVETVNGNGLYTIVTEEEMVVVNGFVASPFATNHAAANAFYNVVRMLPASFLDISIVKRATEIFGAMAASF